MTAKGQPDFLLAGIPGAGKSALRRFLAERGYFDVSFNGEDPPAPTDKLRIALRTRFDEAFLQRSATRLVHELKLVSGRLVAEWGFPINEPCLRFARSIRDGGLPVVWLECPDGLARKRFVARATVPEAAFDVQVPMIRANYDTIMRIVEPVVVAVVGSDGKELTTDEVFLAIASALS